MAGKGGKREGSGRKKGSPNKAKKEFIDLISNKDVQDCLRVLRAARKSENEKLRLEASQYILDQKFGKARQRTDLNLEGGISITVNDFTDESLNN